MITVAEALRNAARRLEQTSDTARLDAELLMAHALGLSRSRMLLQAMTQELPMTFSGMIERRLRHEPIAYIVGMQPFFGRDFIVTPAVLIPRGDSETVVQAALDTTGPAVRLLDCGTGSGALLLAFLSERPGATGVGIDRSEAALAVASQNAVELGLSDRADLRIADWRDSGWALALGQFDLVIANPPYVETTAALDPDVREWEPEIALFAGVDGLDDYRALIPQLPGLLAPGGVAVLEIGAAQAAAVDKLAAAAGFACEVRHDLAGRARALVLRIKLGK